MLQQLSAAAGGVDGRCWLVRGVDHPVRYLDEGVQVEARLAAPHDEVGGDLDQHRDGCGMKNVVRENALGEKRGLGDGSIIYCLYSDFQADIL